MTAGTVAADAPSTAVRPTTRLVITGLGVVAPSGVGAEEHWATVLAGTLCVTPIASFDASGSPVRLAGQVPGFDPTEHVPGPLRVQTDRWTWMSLAATTMALQDAGYDPREHDPYATGVVLAAGSGGNEFGQREIQGLWARGPKAVGAYQSIAWFYAASTGQVSIRDGLKGPSGVVVSEGAGGLDSIGWARRAVRRGTPAVLVGGTEAGLSPYALVCQATSGRLAGDTDPRAAYKPFDRAGTGQVLGEGGAVLLVEDLEHARARQASIRAEVAGYAATHDAHHHEQPAPDATGYTRCLRLALADAGVEPGDVDLVVADAAGTPALDALEAAALREVFGEQGVPVSAPSGFTGRLMAGGSALDVATAVLAMRDGIAPAVGNLDDPAPGLGLDLITTPRPLDLRTVVVAARGAGGFNSCVVLRRYQPEED